MGLGLGLESGLVTLALALALSRTSRVKGWSCSAGPKLRAKLHTASTSAAYSWRRYSRDVGEIKGKYSRDMGEI